MGAVVAGIVSVVVTIGTTVYSIGKAVYNWIIKPLTWITTTVNKVRDIVRGAIDFIRGKIDYVLEITGADILVDLVHKVREFGELAEAIAKGNKEALIKAFAGVYEAISGTAKDILTFVSQSLSPVFERLAVLRQDIKYIQEFRLRKITEQYQELGEELKAMPERLMEDVKKVIEREKETIRKGFEGELMKVNVRLTRVIALSTDLEHFAKMFTELMET